MYVGFSILQVMKFCTERLFPEHIEKVMRDRFTNIYLHVYVTNVRINLVVSVRICCHNTSYNKISYFEA